MSRVRRRNNVVAESVTLAPTVPHPIISSSSIIPLHSPRPFCLHVAITTDQSSSFTLSDSPYFLDSRTSFCTLRKYRSARYRHPQISLHRPGSDTFHSFFPAGNAPSRKVIFTRASLNNHALTVEPFSIPVPLPWNNSPISLTPRSPDTLLPLSLAHGS